MSLKAAAMWYPLRRLTERRYRCFQVRLGHKMLYRHLSMRYCASQLVRGLPFDCCVAIDSLVVREVAVYLVVAAVERMFAGANLTKSNFRSCSYTNVGRFAGSKKKFRTAISYQHFHYDGRKIGIQFIFKILQESLRVIKNINISNQLYHTRAMFEGQLNIFLMSVIVTSLF